MEYLCGVILRAATGMQAWDYSDQFLNIQGLVSLRMTLVWGLLGLGFDRFLLGPLGKVLPLMNRPVLNLLCAVLTVFLAVDLSLTAACVLRWANRHRHRPAANRFSAWLDRHYPDWKMRQKFYYWYFLDEPARPGGRGCRRYPEDFLPET